MGEEMSQLAKDLREDLKNALAHVRGEPAPGTRVHLVPVHEDRQPSSDDLDEELDPSAEDSDPPNSPNPPAANRH
jgi:hypothetical protein